MRFSVELFSYRSIFLKSNSFFKLCLRSRGLIDNETIGIDNYKKESLVLQDKRLGGLGREVNYNHMMMPRGTGIGEAEPGIIVQFEESLDAALIVETNAVKDINEFRQMFCMRLVDVLGNSLDIPLSRPDVEVNWNGLRRYVIPIAEFLNSKFFKKKLK
ncbi:hypothetical protein [Candidatus Contubernalis alkaliaceticus]|uniref:hypothetical protein n=1 Tax=Candidatus Contubernalis alkaliaceticus TaxID=338645 RepID=UPI001F4BE4B5|nr:hypothetical protein [Candidatus Contubernalis alkalaceticus]UNC91554.1 hypothetical protein HUE98_05290 [Candidatus Contubernalis alkalaceticus]